MLLLPSTMFVLPPCPLLLLRHSRSRRRRTCRRSEGTKARGLERSYGGCSPVSPQSPSSRSKHHRVLGRVEPVEIQTSQQIHQVGAETSSAVLYKLVQEELEIAVEGFCKSTNHPEISLLCDQSLKVCGFGAETGGSLPHPLYTPRSPSGPLSVLLRFHDDLEMQSEPLQVQREQRTGREDLRERSEETRGLCEEALLQAPVKEVGVETDHLVC
mmetsp:Transcript_44092/g.87047  ORF Transcript_44092/g.87047 Transcript_44092/m.87047 type:complete len:214 (-) Transcript_44092:179-820(-)